MKLHNNARKCVLGPSGAVKSINSTPFECLNSMARKNPYRKKRNQLFQIFLFYKMMPFFVAVFSHSGKKSNVSTLGWANNLKRRKCGYFNTFVCGQKVKRNYHKINRLELFFWNFTITMRKLLTTLVG